MDLPAIFQERAWDSAKYAVLCAAFALAGVGMVTTEENAVWGWVAIVFFGAGALALGLRTLRRGTLTVDGEGLTATGLHRPVAIRWEHVREFVAAQQQAGPVTQTYVGMNLTGEGLEAAGVGDRSRSTSNALTGCDLILPSTSAYGADLEELVEQLDATLQARRA